MSTSHKPLYGVLLILCSSLLLASHDGFSKYLTHIYPLIMVIWLRYLVQTLAMIVLFFPKMRWAIVRTQRPRLQLLRGICLLSISVLFISGLRYIPLAEATAVMFLAPLIVTVLSALFLHEKISKGQWVAVIVGFLGVLFIVRPGGALFTPAILLPVGGSFCFAIYQLITRRLSSTDHAVTSNFLSGLFGVIVLSALLPGRYTLEVAPIDWLFMLALGLLAMTAHLLLTMALKYSTAATLAPFTYAQIIFAGVVGYLAFAQLPDALSIIGVLIISCSGLAVAYLQHHAQPRG
ncbi:MAG: DMT family transporter [Pseudomonas sp.]|jgi:drug/metabolite transporter (DMT)-like permease|nr:DMT family transporter [Pseudomonas sp.]MDD2223529.1 DMT family transporter [Pseudomonas sp.]MDY0415609.1 DMT family transporter [Pseudomonas sp.]NLO55422.1 DMT family transporter [Gammaproteobacteria bacterium]